MPFISNESIRLFTFSLNYDSVIYWIIYIILRLIMIYLYIKKAKFFSFESQSSGGRNE